MSTLKYQFFENLKIYHPKSDKFNNLPDTQRSNIHMEEEINISLNDFHKHACHLGNYNGNIIDTQSEKFYEKLVDFMIEPVNRRYIKRKDFKLAESSIQSSLNYFMGMISAKIIAKNKYNIPILFHLTENELENIYLRDNIHSKKQPDFIGLDQNFRILIFEAKGKSEGKFSTSITQKANCQLQAIQEVEVEIDNSIFSYRGNDIERHIVGSTFYEKGNLLTIHDIDPKSDGEETLKINLNYHLFNYYRYYMLKLMSKKPKLGNDNIVKVEYEDYTIGLNKKIYDILLNYKKSYLDENHTNIIFEEKYALEIYNILRELETNKFYYSDGVYFKYRNN